jgi:cysteine-rich repeat protein
VDAVGAPVAAPTPGAAGHALRLHDRQVLIRKNFQDFPADEVTVEFMMLSADACRAGTPVSYATGGYAAADNTFVLFDYNDWGVGVMEDEGLMGDHKSGVGATDGKWHHIAVTWRSSDGATKLYDNGRLLWSVTRAKGQRLPSGGTLVIGREQDCEGGCFDSREGASGDVQGSWNQEYGAQDFFGLIDELRIWKKARSQEEIIAGMRPALYDRGRTGERTPPPAAAIDPSNPDLVAYYNFDEGQGYLVKDVTGRGNDLIIVAPPTWEVVRALTVCGNGILEGLEECDVGDARGGNGCSSECKVEPGWQCTKTSPSMCWKEGAAPPGPPPPPGPGPGPAPHHRSVFRALFVSFVTVASVGGGAYAAWVNRERIAEALPAVADAADALRERLLGRRRHTGYDFAGESTMDAEDAEEFTTLRPPPGRGAYSGLPDRSPAGPLG